MFVFLCDNYRDVLERFIAGNKIVRGYKSRLAQAAGCHNSYISQVLKGTVHLTLEQAMNLAAFWALENDETDFFLDLLLRDRAGNERLREFYERRILRARQMYDHGARRTGRAAKLDAEGHLVFYGSWYYAAVRALCATVEYASVERLASRLRIPPPVAKEALRFLEQHNLIARNADGWSLVDHVANLPRSSPMESIDQSHWRQRAILNIQNRDPEALHLREVFPVLKADIPRIKAMVIESFEGAARLAADRGVYDDGMVLTIDFFHL